MVNDLVGVTNYEAVHDVRRTIGETTSLPTTRTLTVGRILGIAKDLPETKGVIEIYLTHDSVFSLI